jgi:carboxypeptidase C (cathepsin A)
MVKKMILLFAIFFLVSADTDNPFNVLGVKGWSGEIDVNTTTGSSLFYYFFESVGGDVASDFRPLVIWLPGGPGCSASVGMFGERISPLFVDGSGNPGLNSGTWASRVHLLAVDFPYGTGYSSPTYWQDWVTNATTAAQVFVNFLDLLQNKHQAWFNRDIYLVGQDYSALYVPAIANLIHIYNRNLGPGHSGYFDLKGVILGDPWINGVMQSTRFDTFLWNQGLVNLVQRGMVSMYENYIIGNASSNPQQAFVSLQNLISYVDGVTGNINALNYRRYSDDYLGNLNTFLNTPAVKQEFNVPSTITWSQCSGSVISNWTSNFYVSQAGTLSTILNYFKILIYSTQDDFLINSSGVQNMVESLSWGGINEFKQARRGIWNVVGNIAGYAQTSSNLTYVQLLNSGLYSGLNQGQNTRDMVFRFIFNQGWN